MRCGRCGNENAESNRFCGMCGTALVKAEPALPAQESSSSSAQGSSREDRLDAGTQTGPVITGPSFLGLSTPGPAVDRPAQAARGRDPLQPSSRNLDYLLEDDEEPKRGGGKLILVLLALALAAGFGYLHWKQGGFDWLKAGDKKPASAASAPGADSGTAGTAAAPAEAGAGTAGTSQNTAQNAPPNAAPATEPGNAAAQNAAPSVPAQNSSMQQPADSNTVPTSAPPAAESDKQSTPAEAPAPAKATVEKPLAAKPAPAKPAAAKPLDAVTEGERYIYGRGQHQDCDRGLRLLKTAAEQSNAKAMISLGALYSTGTCTPRDLPTAYRWFALALHLQPDNQALQDDLQSLWAKMTQPERQLAIKLSQ